MRHVHSISFLRHGQFNGVALLAARLLESTRRHLHASRLHGKVREWKYPTRSRAVYAYKARAHTLSTLDACVTPNPLRTIFGILETR